MVRKRNALIRTALTTIVAVSAVVATMLPATAITGGEEDVENTYSNVGMIVSPSPTGASVAPER